jgi:hypothetical protein
MNKTSLFPPLDPKFQFAFTRVVEAFPVVIPLSKWIEAANLDLFTNQPRKI